MHFYRKRENLANGHSSFFSFFQWYSFVQCKRKGNIFFFANKIPLEMIGHFIRNICVHICL